MDMQGDVASKTLGRSWGGVQVFAYTLVDELLMRELLLGLLLKPYGGALWE